MRKSCLDNKGIDEIQCSIQINRYALLNVCKLKPYKVDLFILKVFIT